MNIERLLLLCTTTRSLVFVFFIFPFLVLAQKEKLGNGRRLNLPDTDKLARDIPHLLEQAGFGYAPGCSKTGQRLSSIRLSSISGYLTILICFSIARGVTSPQHLGMIRNQLELSPSGILLVKV